MGGVPVSTAPLVILSGWQLIRYARFFPQREDVAATLLALLDAPSAAGLSLDIISGETPIQEAVKNVRRALCRSIRRHLTCLYTQAVVAGISDHHD